MENYELKYTDTTLVQEGTADDDQISVTKTTLDRIKKVGKAAPNVVALYMFYAYTAKWQKTSSIHCTTSFAAEGLMWSEPKVRKYKKILLSLGLIQEVIKRAKERPHKITGWYIKVFYISQGTVYPNEKLPRNKATLSPLDPQTLSTNSKTLDTNNQILEKRSSFQEDDEIPF